MLHTGGLVGVGWRATFAFTARCFASVDMFEFPIVVGRSMATSTLKPPPGDPRGCDSVASKCRPRNES